MYSSIMTASEFSPCARKVLARALGLPDLPACMDIDQFVDAMRLWTPVCAFDTLGHWDLSISCICGQERLPTGFIMVHRQTGELLGPIGTTCAKQFEIAFRAERLDEFKALLWLQRESASLPAGRLLAVKSNESAIYPHAVSRKAIRGLLDIEALEPVEDDSLPSMSAEQAFRLLERAFYSHLAKEPQLSTAHTIMEERARPRLAAWCAKGLELAVALSQQNQKQ